MDLEYYMQHPENTTRVKGPHRYNRHSLGAALRLALAVQSNVTGAIPGIDIIRPALLKAAHCTEVPASHVLFLVES